jgi:hypothetical protein
VSFEKSLPSLLVFHTSNVQESLIGAIDSMTFCCMIVELSCGRRKQVSTGNEIPSALLFPITESSLNDCSANQCSRDSRHTKWHAGQFSRSQSIVPIRFSFSIPPKSKFLASPTSPIGQPHYAYRESSP